MVSSTTPWILSASGLKLLGSGELLESPTIIVPRKFLFFQHIDLSAVPRNLWNSVIQQRIRQLSPFSVVDHWQVVEGNSAQVWFWDRRKLSGFQESQELTSVPCIPENLFYSPYDQGFRLQPCFEGWEMQYWHQGVLKQSRWLSALPCEADQQEFARILQAQLLLIDDKIEWVQGSRELLIRPWNEKPFWSKENLQQEKAVTTLALGFLLSMLLLQLGMTLGVIVKEAIATASTSHKQQSLKALVRQRDQALQEQEFNQVFSKYLALPSQLALVANVTSFLTDVPFVLLDWQYQQGQLTLLIQQDQPNPRVIIEQLSKSPLFINVRTEPGQTPMQTRLLMTVKGVLLDEVNNAK